MANHAHFARGRSSLAQWVRLWAGVVAAAGLAGCGAPPVEPVAAPAEFNAWVAERERTLSAESGWLTLVGLHWLAPGENRFGAAATASVRLSAPGVPDEAGAFILKGDRVWVRRRPGAVVTLDGRLVEERELRSDATEAPDVLRVGRLSLHLIKRGQRMGVRVKDPAAPARTNFKGVPRFPYDARMKLVATYEPFARPRELTVPTVTGATEIMRAPGRLRFRAAGRELALLPFVEQPDDDLFIVFSDATSGTETYGAGRFLVAAAPRDGKVVLDFNRAYNPPCAFTPFATCPLPPRENRLSVRIEAGERTPSGH